MKKLCLMVVLSVLFFASTVLAETCPVYPLRDRASIRRLFSVWATTPAITVHGGVQAAFTRMNEIAYLSTFTFLRFPGQRQAFENEYQAWLDAIYQIALNPPPDLSPFGKRFVRYTLFSAYVKLKDTTVQGAAEEEALASSQAANQALKKALSDMWRCF